MAFMVAFIISLWALIAVRVIVAPRERFRTLETDLLVVLMGLTMGYAVLYAACLAATWWS